VAELEKAIEESAPKMGQMSAEERRTQGEAFRARMEGLTDDQRMAVMEAGMAIWVPLMARRFEQDYDKFMAMSPEEQPEEDARLDDAGPAGEV
jgi:hypothetical protein